MLKFVAASVIVAAVGSGTTECQSGTQPDTSARKGEGIGHVHPDYPTAPAPDERSNGRWMVYAIGEEGTRHFVTCWHDSDQSTFREVDISARTYREYLRNPDTGSIPCPR
jgi:hypothetical protein